MKRYKVKGFAFYPEEEALLNDLIEEMGMQGSEIIRYAIRKIAEDEVNKIKIMSDYLQTEGKTITRDKLLRIMSVMKSKKANLFNQGQPSKSDSSPVRHFNFMRWVRICIDLAKKYEDWPERLVALMKFWKCTDEQIIAVTDKAKQITGAEQ